MRPLGSRSERLQGFLFLTVLLAGLAAAILGRKLPAALPFEAPAELFSAGRAMRLLEGLARRPHPVGSEEHECVRASLLEELRRLGFEPEEQGASFFGLPLTNLLVRIPGTDPSGLVLCAAHYDSVPTGPGAGDDGVGVVSWLESLRALRTRGWMPRNDVVLLLSDGEELGLLGAHLFALKHPLAKKVSTVVNLEAIGNGGPAVLFQLGEENGARVRLFQRAVQAPTGTSLADAVYRRMPNDTDLTVFLRRGIGGFNLALATGSAAYHAPHDTPRNLDPQSLQHMGECALVLLEELGESDLGALRAPDVTFFDRLGHGLVVYARGWDYGIALLGLCLVGFAVRRGLSRRDALPWEELRWELALHLFECAFVACMLFALWFVVDRAVALCVPQPEWVPGNTTSTALAFVTLTLGVAHLVAHRAAAARDRYGEERSVARGLAALLWLAIATVAALFLMPGAAFAFEIPLVLAAASQLLVARRDARHAARGAPIELAVALAFAATLALGLPILYQLVQLFQRAPDHALALFGGLLAFLASPFLPQIMPLAALQRGSARRLCLWIALGFLAASVVARGLAWRQGALFP